MPRTPSSGGGTSNHDDVVGMIGDTVNSLYVSSRPAAVEMSWAAAVAGGALVGGASLKASDFYGILSAYAGRGGA